MSHHLEIGISLRPEISKREPPKGRSGRADNRRKTLRKATKNGLNRPILQGEIIHLLTLRSFMKLFKADNGMNIVGQGAKIMMFALPAVFAAIALHLRFPDVAKIPLPSTALFAAGVVLIVPGVALWATAVLQLLVSFPKGKLVCTGAYGVCRNPIYSSFALFILPGISFVTGTWVYIIVSIFMVAAVIIFIGKEEEKLREVFGAEYENYLARVSRVMPFVKPAK
jgi:protein-S-isoprenylcysteine O-methyltransferase Ste14